MAYQYYGKLISKEEARYLYYMGRPIMVSKRSSEEIYDITPDTVTHCIFWGQPWEDISNGFNENFYMVVATKYD